VIATHQKDIHKSPVATLQRPATVLEIPAEENVEISGDLKLTVLIMGSDGVRISLADFSLSFPQTDHFFLVAFIFQKGEKILHTWFNPFFFTSGVTSFPRGEVEGAYKDKKFKTFPADFVLQVETSHHSG